MSGRVKCLVWDLDETLWSGTLVEGDEVALKPGVENVLRALTDRGIVNSIASHNDREPALAALGQLGVAELFVASQIDHDPKSDNIRVIARTLNLSLDAFAFIDNDPFERAEVEYSCPEVRVIPAEEYLQLPAMPGFDAQSETEASRQRVQSYRDEARRREAEDAFGGSRMDFLKSCRMVLTVRAADGDDIARVVELAERTNQINSSGARYGRDEVAGFIEDPAATVAVASLTDRFGDAGLIGAMIARRDEAEHRVESLMVSCRVDGRGVPSALLVLAMRSAEAAGASTLLVRYNTTARNRRLAFLYRMMGFRPTASDESLWSWDVEGGELPAMPEWLTVSLGEPSPVA